MMKKITRLTAAVVFVFSAHVALAGNVTFFNSKTHQVTSKKTQRVMFDVSSKMAFIKHGGDRLYTLTMHIPHIDQVTMSSEASSKAVKIITGAEFKSLWAYGCNSFAMDPPNAVLSATDLRPTVVTLVASHVEGNTILYTFKIIRGSVKPNMALEHVNLTVDSITI